MLSGENDHGHVRRRIPALQDALDEEHWTLFAHIGFMEKITSKKSFLEELELLVMHFSLHSENEEEFLASIQYPYLVAHKAEHAKVIEELYVLKVRVGFESCHALPLFAIKAEDIIRHHVDNYDRLYAAFVADKENS